MASLITAFVCSAVLPLVAHAGAISSTVIPSETRRQGLAQENLCPGDTVLFTCTISSSPSTVRWRLDGGQLFTFANPAEINNTESSNGLTGTLVNATTTTLLVDLSATLDAEVTNGTVIGCEEVGLTVTTTTEMLTIIGVASAPTVSVRPGSLTSLTVDMTVPEYGRECVDMYRATAVVGGVTLEQPVTVTDPSQMMYSFPFSGLDLCRDMLTNATAVAVTNGVMGTMATPVTTDPTDSSVLDRVQLLDDGISSQRQLTSPIRWSQQLNSTNVPSDCVSHFVISWTGSATGSYNTNNASTFSVTPEQLVEGGLPVCVIVILTILPFVPQFGVVTTSAAVVNTQPGYVPMEGPMDVSIVASSSVIGSNVFKFTVKWKQASNPSAIGTTLVGYSMNGMNCIPTITVDSLEKSQVVSIMNVEQLVGASVTACVRYRNMECTSSVISSAQQSTNITGIPNSKDIEVDGNVHVTVRIYDSRFNQFGMSIEPSRPSASQSRGSSTSSRKRQTVLFTWTVVFSGVTRGTTYNYTLVPQDANGGTIGTAITGTFMLPVTSSSLSCNNACIGVVVGLSMIVIIILSIVITFLLTYSVMKKRINQLHQSHQPQDQAMYEDMANFRPGDEDFKMRENSAYGPVKH